MADGVDGAFPLQPDVAGINPGSLKTVYKALYWGQVEECTGHMVGHMMLPGEVKGSKTELMKQAATYAHALNSATIFWAFELVLGYNYASDQSRFLVFH